MISRIKFELSLVSALESDMGWFCIGIESRDFNRSGTKAELIYGNQRLTVFDSRLCLPDLSRHGVKTRRKFGHG